MEPIASVKFSQGQVIISAELKNGESLIADLSAKIHMIAVLEEIAKATPTDIDDKALPFLKTIIGLIESKQA